MQIPANFDPSVLMPVNSSEKKAFVKGFLDAFLERWLLLRCEVTIPTYLCSGSYNQLYASCDAAMMFTPPPPSNVCAVDPTINLVPAVMQLCSIPPPSPGGEKGRFEGYRVGMVLEHLQDAQYQYEYTGPSMLGRGGECQSMIRLPIYISCRTSSRPPL